MASLHQTIIAAVKTAIEGLTGEPTVDIRSSVVKLTGDTLPMIILTKGAQRNVGNTFGSTVYREYDVGVAVIYAQNHAIRTGLDDAAPWVEDIRELLIPDSTSTPPLLSGVSQVWDISEADYAEANSGDFADGYEIVQQTFTFHTTEER